MGDREGPSPRSLGPTLPSSWNIIRGSHDNDDVDTEN